MTWKVSGPEGRFFEHNGTTWTADVTTKIDMLPFLGMPVTMTPTGPVYQPADEEDQAGLFLLAKQFVPGPHTFSGTLPHVPEVAYDAPAGAVF